MLPGIGVFGLLLITVPGIAIEPSSRMTLTLFTTKRTWNEARLICEALGGHLLFMKDAAKEAVVRQFVSGVWDSALGGHSDSFYLGLFNKAVDPSVMTWLDCDELGTLQYWKSSYQPFNPDDKPCVEYNTNGWLSSQMGWETASCYNEEKFVCETFGGACEYDHVSDTEGLDNPSDNLGAVSLGTCQSWCDITVSLDMECWAFSWSASSCVLHFAPSSAYNVTIHSQPATDVTLYTKKCIVGHVDNTTHVTAAMAVTRPFSTCPGAYDPGNGDGKVYTLFDVNMTWTEAAQTCEVIGQQLLMVEDEEESLRLHELYGAASWSIWLGLNGSDTAGLHWVDGSGLTWDNMEPSHPPPGGSDIVCGVAHPDTDTWTTQDCEGQLPFVCQHIGPCLYERLGSKLGEGGDEQSLSRLECETLCDGTGDCVGYSAYYQLLTPKCRLHISTDPLYLYTPSNYYSTSNSYSALYRRSCYAGASLQELPDNLGILQGVNISALSDSSSIIFSTSLMQTVSTLSVEATTFVDISESTLSLETSHFVDISESIISVETTHFVDISESIISVETSHFVDISESTLSLETSHFVDISESIISVETTHFVDISGSTDIVESTVETVADSTLFVDISQSSFSSSEQALVGSESSSLLWTDPLSYISIESSLNSETSISSMSTVQQSFTTNIDPLTPYSSTTAAVQPFPSTHTDSTFVTPTSSSGDSLASTVVSTNSPSTTSATTTTTAPTTTVYTSSTTTTTTTTVSPDSSPSTDPIPSSTSSLTTRTSSTTPTTPTTSSLGSIILGTTTIPPMRTCPCKCYQPTTENETEQLVQKIRKKLLVEKTELTREIRKRTSAPDVRPSAQNIGAVAISFLSITFGLALLADAALLFTHLKMMLWNVFAKKPTQYR